MLCVCVCVCACVRACTREPCTRRSFVHRDGAGAGLRAAQGAIENLQYLSFHGPAGLRAAPPRLWCAKTRPAGGAVGFEPATDDVPLYRDPLSYIRIYIYIYIYNARYARAEVLSCARPAGGAGRRTVREPTDSDADADTD